MRIVVEAIGMSATTALLTLTAIWFGIGLLLALVGSRGVGPAAVLVGGTATGLAAHAKVPVLVVGGGTSLA